MKPVTSALFVAIISLCASVWIPSSALAKDGFFCTAQGIYQQCTNSAGVQTCRDQVSTGMGLAVSKEQAMLDAVKMCSDHMTSMTIIANMGDGGGIKQSCQVVACEASNEVPDDGAESGTAATTGDGGATDASGEVDLVCQQVADGLCEACGQDSPMCQSVMTDLDEATESECLEAAQMLSDFGNQLATLAETDPATAEAAMVEFCNSQ